MTDIERVIKGLNDIGGFIAGRLEFEHARNFLRTIDDALALLKEQPVKTAHWVFGETMGHSWMKCSNCCVSQSGQTACWSFCPNCGANMSEGR